MGLHGWICGTCTFEHDDSQVPYLWPVQAIPMTWCTMPYHTFWPAIPVFRGHPSSPTRAHGRLDFTTQLTPTESRTPALPLTPSHTCVPTHAPNRTVLSLSLSSFRVPSLPTLPFLSPCALPACRAISSSAKYAPPYARMPGPAHATYSQRQPCNTRRRRSQPVRMRQPRAAIQSQQD